MENGTSKMKSIENLGCFEVHTSFESFEKGKIINFNMLHSKILFDQISLFQVGLKTKTNVKPSCSKTPLVETTQA